ncbi:MAG: serine hydrolase [Clostridia bacterium]
MKRKIYHLFCPLIIILSMMIPNFQAIAFEDSDLQDELYCDYYIVQNLDDGSVVMEKNSDVQIAAAGFIKVVAGIVALEAWSDLSEEINITALSLSLIDYDYGVTTAGLEVGTTITKSELLDYLLIYSANDALSVIAYYVSGGFTDFIASMNTLVQEIGCENTNIINMTGFDTDDQYTTAADVSKIMTYGMNYSYFSQCLATTEMVVGVDDEGEDEIYYSTNKMMTSTITDYYHSSITFGKHTSTDLAGQCIAVHTTQDGYSYMVVVMQGEYLDIDDDDTLENTCMTDAQALIDWAYDTLKFKVVAESGQIVASVDVTGSADAQSLQLVTIKEITALVPSLTTSASVLIVPQEDSLPESVQAPIEEGDFICTASVMYAGYEILEIELVAGASVEYSLSQVILAKFSSFVGSLYFLIASGVCFLITVIILILKISKVNKEKAEEEARLRHEKIKDKVYNYKKR